MQRYKNGYVTWRESSRRCHSSHQSLGTSGCQLFDAEEGGKASRLVANVQRWTAEVGGQVHIISYLLDEILPGRKGKLNAHHLTSSSLLHPPASSVLFDQHCSYHFCIAASLFICDTPQIIMIISHI